MTSDACRELRGALGEEALGRLAPIDGVALRAHLDGCAECRAEFRELTEVARAIPRADIDRIAAGRDEPPRELPDLVLARVARERTLHRRHRRGRVVAVAGSIAAALVVAVLVAASVTDDSSVPDPDAAIVVAFPAYEGADARAELHARPAGTEIVFHVDGLNDRDTYWLWLTGDDGKRVTAGTFDGAGGEVDVVMTAAVPVDAARRIWVTDADDRVVFDAQLPTR